jgi:hypothetical protein
MAYVQVHSLHIGTRMKPVALIVAALVSLTAATARAEEADSWVVTGPGIPLLIGLELAPLALGVADLVARPSSRTYGGVEVAVGGTTAAVNVYLAINPGDCSSCDDGSTVFAMAAVVDLAVLAHGAYLLLRERDDEPAITLGSARGNVSPTIVSDGRVAVAGIGLGGTF